MLRVASDKELLKKMVEYADKNNNFLWREFYGKSLENQAIV
jgi:hypothetical protein